MARVSEWATGRHGSGIDPAAVVMVLVGTLGVLGTVAYLAAMAAPVDAWASAPAAWEALAWGGLAACALSVTALAASVVLARRGRGEAGDGGR